MAMPVASEESKNSIGLPCPSLGTPRNFALRQSRQSTLAATRMSKAQRSLAPLPGIEDIKLEYQTIKIVREKLKFTKRIRYYTTGVNFILTYIIKRTD
jgi:hypothetical protein